MQTLDDTTTLIDLEQLVNGDDCKCQSTHDVPGTTVCTITVVARKSVCDMPAFNICQSSLNYNMSVLANLDRRCSGCKRPAFACWRVYPI